MVGPRTTVPFGAESTAEQVLAGVDLTGRRVVVTGGTSGVGMATARALAGANAEVTLAVRDLAAGRRSGIEIMRRTGNRRVRVARLDLAEPESVDGFVRSWDGPLDILVNDAAVTTPALTRTGRGWELQFAANHLGHFALALGLHGALASAGDARVVSVSSVGHTAGAVVLDDLHFRRRPYERRLAYGQSRTANVLFAVAADRRWSGEGIRVNALNPGRLRGSGPRRPGRVPTMSDPDIVGAPGKSIEQGAATSVLLAASPLVEGVGGRYFEDCAVALPYRAGSRGGVAAYAVDPELADRLWNRSLTLVRSL